LYRNALDRFNKKGRSRRWNGRLAGGLT